MKKFNEYMPEKEGEKELIQGRVNKELKQKVAAVLEREKWSWVEFLEGAMQKFLDENNKRSAG